MHGNLRCDASSQGLSQLHGIKVLFNKLTAIKLSGLGFRLFFLIYIAVPAVSCQSVCTAVKGASHEISAAGCSFNGAPGDIWGCPGGAGNTHAGGLCRQRQSYCCSTFVSLAGS